MLPNNLNASEIILEKCERISTGNIRGANHFTGPAK